MATLSTSIPTIRHTIRCNTSPSSIARAQKRWARVHDVRFVTTQQPINKALEKYKAKLEQKAKQEGHESISALKEAYKEKILDYRKAATPPAQTVTVQQQKSSPLQPPPLPTPQTQAAVGSSAKAGKSAAGGVPGIKPLSSYLDLDKVRELPQKELEYIWRLRHANDSLSLCAVIPVEIYQRIYKTAKIHPQFVLPLPRPAAEDASGDVKQSPQGFEGGAERTAADIHFLQWNFHPPAGPPAPPNVRTSNTHTSTVLFTHLAAFKLHGTYAQPHTTITHHLDLADSHGLVLLNGSVVDGRGVSVEEGRWLLRCLQKFYDFEGHGGGVGKEKRQNLLKQFSTGDQGFSLEALVDEAERVS